ncbi:phage tail protein [Kordiimonas lacus]|uniref:Microcystin-dependent protein n=1 Tax=Kordiimonas lacus TaxID=637679 RepID=A0A1G6XY28_9PROT|nr:tail fiber protein [Kordiimonas lacus]SDD83108.1 Microcystin-dependent protein [Kordiimonas lacus]
MTLKPIHLAACAALGTAASLFASDDAQAGCNPAYAFIGDICATGANYCPAGTAMANGHLLPIADYQELYAVLGNIYGGDGSTTFALPDLRMRAPVGTGQYDVSVPHGMQNSASIGEKLGRLNTIQTERQLAHHTHEATASYPTGSEGPSSSSQPQAAATKSSDMTKEQTSPAEPPTITVMPTGHSNSMYLSGPRLAVTYCVITEGNFPNRNK